MNMPPSPPANNWRFVAELNEPLWTKHPWSERMPQPGEASLQGGVRLQPGFNDPAQRLQTAYSDLERFLRAGAIGRAGEIALDGDFAIVTQYGAMPVAEAFEIEVTATACTIRAADTEGIRRGIFYLEDEMLRRRGPFLPLGTFSRQPFIKKRISRSCYAPIKRPGNYAMMGDELLDEVDYYPDNYLDRLAHEGVNGLWVTLSSKDGKESSVGFGDLVATSITPQAGVDGEKRLAKLRRVVERGLRYGIRIYLKTMEPHVVFADDDPILQQHPELMELKLRNQFYLCGSSPLGQQYLYEATGKIFAAVPELGGIINITHGELHTNCLGYLPATGGGQIRCERCAKLPHAQVLHAPLNAMLRGMREAAPAAELISWLYMPQPQFQSATSPDTLADWVYTIPAATPNDVILQFNFESGVTREEFGKTLVGGDYWLSAPGPSDRFERVATIAREKGTAVSAKIQTGTGYEVATVPHVPVPSNLYRKFAAMRRLGVTHTMMNWIIGSAPGLMNKAAGELSFEPFPPDENEFLHHLAHLYWRADDVEAVVRAWQLFSEGYEQYPLTNMFQYYGPMNDGPAWPLLLKPEDSILAPVYQLGSRNTSIPWPPSGDRVGECFTDVLSLDEMVQLCRRMSHTWDTGLALLLPLEAQYQDEPERLRDIGVAKALGILFRSGYNILHFYSLREKMLRQEGLERLDLLAQLETIVREERELSARLSDLCEQDSRLGFHADAEGFKFFPAKLQWRIEQLDKLLANDFPEFEQAIEKGHPLFPEYTGKTPTGSVAQAVSRGEINLEWQACHVVVDKHLVEWQAYYDPENLYFVIRLAPGSESLSTSPFAQAQIKIEPRRLWPAKHFFFNLQTPDAANGVSLDKDSETDAWFAACRVPLSHIGLDADTLHPIRMDIRIQLTDSESVAWCPNNQLDPRLLLGGDNPADLGWLVFK